MYNPKCEEVFAPEIGPENPFQTRQQQARKNMPSGSVEQAYRSDFHSENQCKTVKIYGM
jgi:pre-mRNA-processing factor 17